MKATVEIFKENKVKEYPKLMISDDGLIVLFTKSSTGTVVKQVKSFKIGYYSDEFIMHCFTDFDGSVTLQND